MKYAEEYWRRTAFLERLSRHLLMRDLAIRPCELQEFAPEVVCIYDTARDHDIYFDPHEWRIEVYDIVSSPIHYDPVNNIWVLTNNREKVNTFTTALALARSTLQPAHQAAIDWYDPPQSPRKCAHASEVLP